MPVTPKPPTTPGIQLGRPPIGGGDTVKIPPPGRAPSSGPSGGGPGGGGRPPNSPPGGGPAGGGKSIPPGWTIDPSSGQLKPPPPTHTFELPPGVFDD